MRKNGKIGFGQMKSHRRHVRAQRVIGRPASPALLSRILSARDGIAGVEFALIVPALLTMIVGVVEFGRVYWLQGTLQYAAEQAGRYAMANTGASAADLVVRARDSLEGIDDSKVEITVAWDSGSSGSFVSVKTSSTFEFLGGLVNIAGGLDLAGKSRVPLPGAPGVPDGWTCVTASADGGGSGEGDGEGDGSGDGEQDTGNDSENDGGDSGDHSSDSEDGGDSNDGQHDGEDGGGDGADSASAAVSCAVVIAAADDGQGDGEDDGQGDSEDDQEDPEGQSQTQTQTQTEDDGSTHTETQAESQGSGQGQSQSQDQSQGNGNSNSNSNSNSQSQGNGNQSQSQSQP